MPVVKGKSYPYTARITELLLSPPLLADGDYVGPPVAQGLTLP